jgi:folylpolyglutamate synthase/dihydropteroate synthase
MMQDKEYRGFFANLAQWAGWRSVICYRGMTARAADPETLAAVARRFFPRVEVAQTLEQALELSAKNAEKVLRVVATGTLYSIGRLYAWRHRPHG